MNIQKIFFYYYIFNYYIGNRSKIYIYQNEIKNTKRI